jgi:HK97 family phage prohead protease
VPPLLTREYRGTFVARAAGDGTDERIVEGIVVPFGEIVTVADRAINGGAPYRETIARGATAGLDPSRVLLDLVTDPPGAVNEHRAARLIGRGIGGELRGEGQHMAFRVARTVNGDEGLELAREGVLGELSVNFEPVKHRTRADGVVERTAINVRRVALVPIGAYTGAQVTAVRAEREGAMPPESTTAPAATGETADDEAETPAPEATPATDTRPNRTRVTVDVERAERQDRAALERSAVASLGGSGGGRGVLTRTAPIELGLARGGAIVVTRDELVYGPGSGQSYLRDLVAAGRGESAEAAERQARHHAMLADVAVELERAGDVLSSEIPGAYPNNYMPGLLTPGILKGRPMGGFYNRVPISSGNPILFPKVTTSTSVAVQAAEGTNPAASDFATTAVTVTPLIYGGETVVSRQVIDGASPGAEQMIFSDLEESYAQASEAVIKTAVEAGSSASGTAIAVLTPFAGTMGNVIAYYGARFRPAGAQFIPPALFAVLLAELDTTGRPKMPNLGPINSSGTTDDGGTGGGILGAQTFLSYASTANVVVTGRADDFAIFESPVARFSYDAVTGPAGVRIGLWGYLVVGARLGSLKVTAA